MRIIRKFCLWKNTPLLFDKLHFTFYLEAPIMSSAISTGMNLPEDDSETAVSRRDSITYTEVRKDGKKQKKQLTFCGESAIIS